jgi:hypothetical protein
MTFLLLCLFATVAGIESNLFNISAEESVFARVFVASSDPMYVGTTGYASISDRHDVQLAWIICASYPGHGLYCFSPSYVIEHATMKCDEEDRCLVYYHVGSETIQRITVHVPETPVRYVTGDRPTPCTNGTARVMTDGRIVTSCPFDDDSDEVTVGVAASELTSLGVLVRRTTCVDVCCWEQGVVLELEREWYSVMYGIMHKCRVGNEDRHRLYPVMFPPRAENALAGFILCWALMLWFVLTKWSNGDK